MRPRSWICNISIVIMLTLTSNILWGCSSKKQEAKESSETFDMKAASNVADTYMKYLMKDDTENIKKFYSKEISKNASNQENKNLKILGYNQSETSEIGKTGLFKMRVTRADLTNPSATLDEYSLKIKKEGLDYKIDETNNVVQKEAFIQNNQIRLRNKNNVDTNLLIDTNGIPNYTLSKDDKANVNKISVPKSKYGVITFSYSGDSIAISTFEKDSYIALVKLDEAMAVQGDADQGGEADKEGGDQQNGGDQQKGVGGKGKEKPIGKEITSLDLLRDTKVEFITFAPTEKFVAVQYSKAGLGRCIRVYKADGGDMIPFKFEEKYPMNKVDIVFSSYDKENLNFDVIPKKAEDRSAADVIGKWQLSLKDFKQKKL
ncbi:hypothetical protein [Clostridium sp. DJ247]|uniref:hypothetical protein n=1 Tax=Clostridium sp. DJ247 TaxID=2726188 RepID=UPI0016237AEE|nr:hypothetical protein [Clostridium sp. DJ247]MBC2580907.1 hypothetical protein [Clostridium sp. DJ247]